MRRPGVVLLIAILICVAVGALGYFLIIGPKKGKVDNKSKEIEKTQNMVKTEQSTYQQLLDIKNRTAEYEARLGSLQAKIPAQPELPSLIRNIQAAADPGTGAGLPWLSFAPGEVTAGGQGYSTYSFSMRAGGFYNEVVDLIYRMERFQRAVVIDSVSMAATTTILETVYSPNLGLVQADINGNTFTFYVPTGVTGTQQTEPTTTPTQSGTQGTKQSGTQGTSQSGTQGSTP